MLLWKLHPANIDNRSFIALAKAFSILLAMMFSHASLLRAEETGGCVAETTRKTVSTPGNSLIPFVGGWYFCPETDNTEAEDTPVKSKVPAGFTWMEFRSDGTWWEIYERCGRRNEVSGTWTVKDKVASLDLGTARSVSFRLLNGELILAETEEERPVPTLKPMAEAPKELLALPLIPRTVDEAVTVLRDALSKEDQAEIASLRKRDLIQYHFGLGMYIRNAFCLLGKGNTQMLASCGDAEMDADSASSVIIRALWESLRRDRPDYTQLVELEARLQIKIAPFPVRNMPYEAFVDRLNDEMKVALKTAGHSPDEVNFVFVYRDDAERECAEKLRLCFHPMMKIWGAPQPGEATDLPLHFTDQAFDAKLRPPSTVELRSRRFSFAAQSLEDPFLWQKIEWVNDSFEATIRTPPISTAGGSDEPGMVMRPFVLKPSGRGYATEERSMTWEMKGARPPMPVNIAISLFMNSETSRNGEKVVSVEMANHCDFHAFRMEVEEDGILSTTRDDPELWEYVVTGLTEKEIQTRKNDLPQDGSLTTEDGRDYCCRIAENDFDEKCAWADLSTPPPLSPESAVERLRNYLKDNFGVQNELGSVIIELKRLGPSDYWYYEIQSGTDDVQNKFRLDAFVLMNGCVLPFVVLRDN